MGRRSPSLADKISAILESNTNLEKEIDNLFDSVSKSQSFEGQPQLQEHLCEGSLLNVGRIASNALSIP